MVKRLQRIESQVLYAVLQPIHQLTKPFRSRRQVIDAFRRQPLFAPLHVVLMGLCFKVLVQQLLTRVERVIYIYIYIYIYICRGTGACGCGSVGGGVGKQRERPYPALEDPAAKKPATGQWTPRLYSAPLSAASPAAVNVASAPVAGGGVGGGGLGPELAKLQELVAIHVRVSHPNLKFQTVMSSGAAHLDWETYRLPAPYGDNMAGERTCLMVLSLFAAFPELTSIPAFDRGGQDWTGTKHALTDLT